VRQILKARIPAPAIAAAEHSAPVGVAGGLGGLQGLRWIASISSTVRIDGDGLYAGTMEAVMNTQLLKEEAGAGK
jgi:hypothetical protein